MSYLVIGSNIENLPGRGRFQHPPILIPKCKNCHKVLFYKQGLLLLLITAVAADDNDTNNVLRMFHISADVL